MHVTFCLITQTPMSNILPPLLIPAADRENSEAFSMVSLPPLSSWSGGHRAFSSFSSPPPSSSSPPMTPFTKESHIYTHIRSSPDVASEHGYYPQRDRSVNSLTWDRSDVPKASGTNCALPSFKSTFAGEASIPLPSRYDASALYDGVSTHFHENPSYSPRLPHSNVFYDSEEDGQDEDDGFSVEEDCRATFFRTSAERGQWRYDPIPVKPHPRSQMRKSIPSWSPDAFPGLQLVSRPISEPAPSTSRMQSPSILPDSHDEHEDVSDLRFTFPISSDHECMMHDARQSLPSLVSDRDTSPEQEEMHLSSPLPPSSPPLSYSSFPRSPTVRSVSPLSFAPSSPPPVPSSPLAFSSSDDSIELDEETGPLPVLVDHPENVALIGSEPTAVRPSGPEEVKLHPPIAHDPEHGASSSPIAIISSSSLPSLEIPAVATDIQTIRVALEETPSPHQIPIMLQKNPPLELLETALPVSPVDTLSDVVKCDKDIVQASVQTEVASGVEALPEHLSATLSTMASDVGVKANLLIDKIVSEGRATSVESKHGAETDRGTVEGSSDAKVVTEKRKKPAADSESDGPPKKKRCAASKHEGKRRLEDEQSDVSDAKKQKKNDRATASGKTRRPSHSCSHPTPSAAKTSNGPSSSRPRQHDSDSPELDAEITGMLIECMATSRASSLPISSLYKSVMQCRPSLKAQRSEKEWVAMFRRVLRDGVAGTGVFGKVESSGKDDSDHPLEAQWFYVPERDSDQERATLIRSMMPRPSKRTETKKSKQYYYRPLEKISRWDAEDDI